MGGAAVNAVPFLGPTVAADIQKKAPSSTVESSTLGIASGAATALAVIVLPFSSFHNRVKDAIQLQDEKEIAAYRRKPLCLFFHIKNLGGNPSSSEYKKVRELYRPSCVSQ